MVAPFAPRIRLLVMLATAAFALTPTASVAADSPNLADIEDEVMCPICGTALGLSDSPQARRQRAFIQDLIDRGRSTEQIKQALIREYGPGVLAVPEDDTSFNILGWILPATGLGLAALLLSTVLVRWRRGSGPPDAGTPSTTGAERTRVDEDMARYGL